MPEELTNQREQATAQLERVLLELESYDASRASDRQIYDEVCYAVKALLTALRHGKLTVSETSSRFVADLAHYIMDDFPRVLEMPFRRFGLDVRYEFGTQEFDQTYIYQDAWAAERVMALNPAFFVDVGSTVYFVTLTSRVVPCVAVDARPTPLALANLTYRQGEAQALPFDDDSVPVLTCLHAADHFGLGRYGDTVSNKGLETAVAEFQRVVPKDGILLISVPTQREPCTVFNKMNCFTPELLHELFDRCEVIEDVCFVPNPATRAEHDNVLEQNPTKYCAYAAMFRKMR